MLSTHITIGYIGVRIFFMRKQFKKKKKHPKNHQNNQKQNEQKKNPPKQYQWVTHGDWPHTDHSYHFWIISLLFTHMTNFTKPWYLVTELIIKRNNPILC